MITTGPSSVAPANKLRLHWLVGNLLAFTLSYALFGVIDILIDAVGAHGVTTIGIAGHLAALALGATIVALVQSLLIRLYLTHTAQWGLTVGLAYVTAFFIGEVVGGLPLGLLVSFTLFGAVGGALQIRLLRLQGLPAIRWALATCLGWAGGGAVATGLLLAAFAVAGRAIIETAPVPVAFAIVGGIGGGVGAALTGHTLGWVLQHHSTQT